MADFFVSNTIFLAREREGSERGGLEVGNGADEVI